MAPARAPASSLANAGADPAGNGDVKMAWASPAPLTEGWWYGVVGFCPDRARNP